MCLRTERPVKQTNKQKTVEIMEKVKNTKRKKKKKKNTEQQGENEKELEGKEKRNKPNLLMQQKLQ